MGTVFDIKIYRMPGEKRTRRIEITPEELEFSRNLGNLIGKHGYNAFRHVDGATSEDVTSAPNYISDHMEATRHMATGEMYDSKSAFRAKTKELGLVEIGNDTKALTRKNTQLKMDKRSRVEAIQKAVYQLRNK